MSTLSADERSRRAAGVGAYLARVQGHLPGGVAPPSSLPSPQQAADARVREGTSTTPSGSTCGVMPDARVREGTSLTAWVETLESIVPPLCRRGN